MDIIRVEAVFYLNLSSEILGRLQLLKNLRVYFPLCRANVCHTYILFAECYFNFRAI